MSKGKRHKKRGPSPDRVKIDGDWTEAVKKALQKKRPEEGWPKHHAQKQNKEG